MLATKVTMPCPACWPARGPRKRKPRRRPAPAAPTKLRPFTQDPEAPARRSRGFFVSYLPDSVSQLASQRLRHGPFKVPTSRYGSTVMNELAEILRYLRMAAAHPF